MRQKQRTFDEILTQVATGNVHRLLDRARTANRLAKLLTGKARASAYSVKHDALTALASRFPNRVTISNDPRAAELLMADLQVRRLPVVDHDRRLVGIVSLRDLAGAGETSEAAEPAGSLIGKVLLPAC